MKTICLLSASILIATNAFEHERSDPSLNRWRGGRPGGNKGGRKDWKKKIQGFDKEFFLTLPGGIKQAITLSKGKISFQGCNSHNADIKLDHKNKTVHVGNFISTRKACIGGEFHDDEVVHALSKVKSYAIDKKTHQLILKDAHGNEIGRLRPIVPFGGKGGKGRGGRGRGGRGGRGGRTGRGGGFRYRRGRYGRGRRGRGGRSETSEASENNSEFTF